MTGGVAEPSGITCVNSVPQLGVVLHSQQGLVITRVLLQEVLGAAGHHPDPGPVLIRDAFTHKPLHFQNDRFLFLVK